jgi:hypothetical protein
MLGVLNVKAPRGNIPNCFQIPVGAAEFKQKLSQIATMYKDSKDGYEPKASQLGMATPMD